MFAVPGWSVSSATLATQSDPRTGSTGRKPAPDPDGPVVMTKTSTKRKRVQNHKQSFKMTDENFTEQWEKVIEGKGKVSAGGGQVTSSGAEAQMTKKKRKRGGRNKDEEPGASDSVNVEVEEATSKQEIEGRMNLLDEKREEKLVKQASGDAPPDRSQASLVKTPSVPVQGLRSAPTKPTLTPLQLSMRQKLTAARFRHLNQTLYTTPSSHSLNLFRDSPEMFDEYHEGFRRQVEIWPENPVVTYIELLRARASSGSSQRFQKPMKPLEASSLSDTIANEPLPRTGPICTIADLGCGDARLASTLAPVKKKFKLEFKSYDLTSNSPHVIAADIANLPLDDGAVNVAIFCLALMGTNWLDFIDEAYRILHWRGELWIAEIKSRFGRVGGDSSSKGRVAHSVGNRQNRTSKPLAKAKARANAEAEGIEHDAALAVEVDGESTIQEKGQTDVSAFLGVLRRRGFVLAGSSSRVSENGESAVGDVDLHNKMFVSMRFIKAVAPVRGKHVPVEGEMGFKGGIAKTARYLHGSKTAEEEPSEEQEAQVLKPCVYKLR